MIDSPLRTYSHLIGPSADSSWSWCRNPRLFSPATALYAYIITKARQTDYSTSLSTQHCPAFQGKVPRSFPASRRPRHCRPTSCAYLPVLFVRASCASPILSRLWCWQWLEIWSVTVLCCYVPASNFSSVFSAGNSWAIKCAHVWPLWWVVATRPTS